MAKVISLMKEWMKSLKKDLRNIVIHTKVKTVLTKCLPTRHKKQIVPITTIYALFSHAMNSKEMEMKEEKMSKQNAANAFGQTKWINN